MNIWEEIKKPILILAPMEGVTDIIFRQVIAKAKLFCSLGITREYTQKTKQNKKLQSLCHEQTTLSILRKYIF